MLMIWFTADTHFGHAGILRHQPLRGRWWSTTEDMDSDLLDAIHKVVRPEDQIWHLGDFCWHASKAGHYRQRLPKRVQLHVLRGNHDATSLRRHCSSFQGIAWKPFDGKRFHLCHYPIWSWRNRVHGSYHLYGHCHGMAEEELNIARPDRRAMDVGVDYAYQMFGEWRPFSLSEVCEILSGRDSDVAGLSDRCVT